MYHCHTRSEKRHEALQCMPHDRVMSNCGRQSINPNKRSRRKDVHSGALVDHRLFTNGALVEARSSVSPSQRSHFHRIIVILCPDYRKTVFQWFAYISGEVQDNRSIESRSGEPRAQNIILCFHVWLVNLTQVE